MPQNLRMAMTRCMFSILEAVEAEWLIGNLPSISASTRKDIYELCERIEHLGAEMNPQNWGHIPCLPESLFGTKVSPKPV